MSNDREQDRRPPKDEELIPDPRGATPSEVVERRVQALLPRGG